MSDEVKKLRADLVNAQQVVQLVRRRKVILTVGKKNHEVVVDSMAYGVFANLESVRAYAKKKKWHQVEDAKSLTFTRSIDYKARLEDFKDIIDVKYLAKGKLKMVEAFLVEEVKVKE